MPTNIQTITTNVRGRDFTVTLDSEGRFTVEGGLRFGHRWDTSMAEAVQAIESDMDHWAEFSPNEPWMSNTEWEIHKEAIERDYQRSVQRDDAAIRRTTAAEFGRITDTYILDGGRLEAVKVRAMASGRGRWSRGFNITVLSSGLKDQDRQVYRLTPKLVSLHNDALDKQRAAEALTEDVPSLTSLDVMVNQPHGSDHWTVTVEDQVRWGLTRKGREAAAAARKVHAEHKVTFDPETGLFVADDGTTNSELYALADVLGAAVHPQLGKWLVTVEDGEPVMREATVESITNTDRYRSVEVVDDEQAAKVLMEHRGLVRELTEKAERIRRAIFDTEVYTDLNRNDLANWPILGVDILTED